MGAHGMVRMDRAFVTGGTGFIGRRLVRDLRRRGLGVAALARSPGGAEELEREGVRVVRGDLLDQDALRDGMSGADTVFHLAARIGDWGDEAEYRRVNVDGTATVVAAARASGVARLVHVSTEAVLLDGRPLVNVDETHPYPARPLGPYARTKGDAERLVIAANGPELETVVVRPRFVWGATDATLLREMADAVRSGRFQWIGGGHHLTSTAHVANVVHGLVLASERGRPGEIYFIIDGPPVPLRRIVTAMLSSVGLDPGDRSIAPSMARVAAALVEPLWRVLRRPGPPPVTRTAVAVLGLPCTVNDAKARRELGYVPVISFDEGLASLESADS